MAAFQIWDETIKSGGGLRSKTLYFPSFCLFSSWRCFTSISLLSWSAYRSKLADWSIPQCFTTLWSIKVIEWKSRALSVCKDLISVNVFLPTRFPPPRDAEFVVHVAFALKWTHSQFGIKRSNPGGATVPKVVFSLLSCFWQLALFHVNIFVAFEWIQVKVGRVVLSWMVYKSVKHQRHRMEVTWLLRV